jgi:hypothetical protein
MPSDFNSLDGTLPTPGAGRLWFLAGRCDSWRPRALQRAKILARAACPQRRSSNAIVSGGEFGRGRRDSHRRAVRSPPLRKAQQQVELGAGGGDPMTLAVRREAEEEGGHSDLPPARVGRDYGLYYLMN